MTAARALRTYNFIARGADADVRYPFAPLEQRINPTVVADVCVALGVTRRQVYHWRRNGVNCWQADAMAIHLGLHPIELWPDFLDNQQDPEGIAS